MNHINKYRQFLLLLLFVSIGTVLSAQNIQVTGTVTDKLGPMAGVNIVLTVSIRSRCRLPVFWNLRSWDIIHKRSMSIAGKLSM